MSRKSQNMLVCSMIGAIKVGHEVSKHFCSELKFSITFLESNSQTPLPYKNYKIVVDNILINVEKLLSRELRKVCLHTFHSRADQHSACAKTVKPNAAKTKNLLLRRLCLILLINLYNVFTIGRSTEKVKKLNTFRYNCWVGIFLLRGSISFRCINLYCLDHER